MSLRKLLLFFLSVAASQTTVAYENSSLQPVHLTCEYRVNPLGIDVSLPAFSWQFNSSKRNQFQTAYEIVVSTDAATLKMVKDEGSAIKIKSSQNLHVLYNGQPLRSFTRYYWRVRTYDQNDLPSEWSELAWFETAMLSPSDWKAQWIDDGQKQFERDEDFYKDDRMPLFRKEFNTSKKIVSARLYIAGLGYYEAFLNGKKINDHVLDPGWTTYKKQIQYVVHDVTPLMKSGANVMGVMLGNGWWNPLPLRLFTRYNLRDVQQTGRPCLKAEIHIHYADGTSDLIPTDNTWQTAAGPIVRNSVFLGEHYDARLEQKDWKGLLPDKKLWKAATATQGPAGALQVQQQPPIKVTKVLKPVSIVEHKPGVFIVDMGQNFAGVARIKVKGKAATKVTLRYGEALHADGSLNFFTTTAGHIKQIWNLKGGPGSPATAWQEDSYILKGTGVENWNPLFTFHGFRFVEITGWPGIPTVNDVEGLRMNSDLKRVGEFSCSNETFNRIHEVIQWTFLSNVFSVQSDCPGREKMGYGADIVTTANAYMYNFDMHTFYSKTVQDFANEQQPDGGITEIAPYTGIADRGVGGESGPLGWQLAFPYTQKRLYEFYGDKRIIEQHYPAFVKQMEFLQSKAINGLFHWDISDHVAIDPRPEAFTAAAFYYHHALLATEFAGILGKVDDSVKYQTLSQQIKKDIVSKYLVPNTGRFDNATQSAQLFALWYKLSPEKEKTFKVLMDEFERHQWHVSSGIFGVMMMFDVLRENNQNEIAYRIANQKDFPGWAYMLSKGATTLWESWEYPENASSQNHPMFGSLDEWFYRSLLGINPEAPGFRKIKIRPQPAGDLTWAKGSYQSVNGEIKSSWRKEGNKFTLLVSIPPNTRADIWIPGNEQSKITEDGKILTNDKNKKAIRFAEHCAVFSVGSGEYAFESIGP